MVRRGKLQRVITTVLEESGLKVDAPSFTIAKDTVRSRVKAQTDLTKSSCGIAIPMATVEPLLVELFLQKAQMGQPLGIREGICFANSIIEGTVHEEAMVYLKTRLKIRESDVSTLGSKYWRKFRRRNEDILESGSGETQASARREWSTHLNFTKLYDLVYDRMEEARILEALDEPVWMNHEGEIFMSSEEALEMKVTHQVKHP